MRKFFTSMFAAMFVLVCGFGALADGATVNFEGGGPYGQVVGDQVILSNTATNAAFNFGFEAEKVRICFIAAGASGDTVWFKFGTSIAANGSGVTSTADITSAASDKTGMTTVATNDTDFQNGVTHTVSPDGTTYTVPPALPLSPTYAGNSADTVDARRPPQCNEFAFKTRGLIFHNAAASTAILDVWAFGKRPKLRSN